MAAINGKGWIGLVLTIWPLVRIGFQYFGIDVPDLGPLPWQELSMASTAAGTALLAKAPPIGEED